MNAAETPEEISKAATAMKPILDMLHEPWNYYVGCGAKANSQRDVFDGISSANGYAVSFYPKSVKSAALRRFVTITDKKKRERALSRLTKIT